MKYNELRTLAFRFSPEMTTVPHKFFTLDFPEHWKPKLLELQRETLKYPRENVQIPIRMLNKALRALVSGKK